MHVQNKNEIIEETFTRPERIQKFHNKVMLIKELPFVNVRNAAFLNCMNFNAALKTKLSKTKAKLQKNVKLCKAVAEDSKYQIEIAQQKNSELQQKVLELENKLSIVQLNDNKIQHLEKQLLKTENEKSTLYQRTQDLQNQLSTLQVSGDKVVTLENKVSSLKKELETAEMCFREMNRRLNADLMQCEKEKQQYI